MGSRSWRRSSSTQSSVLRMELRAVRSMEALRRMERIAAKVLRDGQVREIPADQLVPGDIVRDGGRRHRRRGHAADRGLPGPGRRKRPDRRIRPGRQANRTAGPRRLARGPQEHALQRHRPDGGVLQRRGHGNGNGHGNRPDRTSGRRGSRRDDAPPQAARVARTHAAVADVRCPGRRRRRRNRAGPGNVRS